VASEAARGGRWGTRTLLEIGIGTVIGYPV